MNPVHSIQTRLRRSLGLVQLSGHHAYLHALSKESMVIDAGANRGAFSRAARKLLACRVIALEPNPALAESLLSLVGVHLLQGAIGPSSGRATFYISSNSEGSSLRGELVPGDSRHTAIDVRVVSIEELLGKSDTGAIDLLKLDVEGAEIPLLLETSAKILQSIPQISVEFHSFLDADGEAAKVRAVSERLESLGFLRFRASAPAIHDVDVLFLNRGLLDLPWITRTYLLVVEPLLSSLRIVGDLARRSLRRSPSKVSSCVL